MSTRRRRARPHPCLRRIPASPLSQLSIGRCRNVAVGIRIRRGARRSLTVRPSVPLRECHAGARFVFRRCAVDLADGPAKWWGGRKDVNDAADRCHVWWSPERRDFPRPRLRHVPELGSAPELICLPLPSRLRSRLRLSPPRRVRPPGPMTRPQGRDGPAKALLPFWSPPWARVPLPIQLPGRYPSWRCHAQHALLNLHACTGSGPKMTGHIGSAH